MTSQLTNFQERVVEFRLSTFSITSLTIRRRLDLFNKLLSKAQANCKRLIFVEEAYRK
jgi:hypothetical protein